MSPRRPSAPTPSAQLLLIIIAAFYLLTSTTAYAESGPTKKTCNKPSLDILLTNDDGYDKPGIRALHRVFKGAGHRVVLAAPAGNASGSSTSVTFAPIKVSEAEPNIYAIEASPASTVLLGVGNYFPDGPPDLVISGINKGANLGPATPVSGTVGATIAALLLSEPAIPAIAISTDSFQPTSGTDVDEQQANLEHLDRIAHFVLTMVTRLQGRSCNGGALLPPRLALNVNYPPIPDRDIKGVKLTQQSRTPTFRLSYAPSENNPRLYAPRFEKQLPALTGDEGDTSAFHQGYITIVPIDGNYTADAKSRASIARWLEGLEHTNR